MEHDVEQHHGPPGSRNPHPVNSFRPWVFESRRKNRELVLLAKSCENSKVALPDRVVRRHDVVE